MEDYEREPMRPSRHQPAGKRKRRPQQLRQRYQELRRLQLQKRRESR
jgi:hypothetical protein